MVDFSLGSSTRSHRDFRNREAEFSGAQTNVVATRAVTATSGIVRRRCPLAHPRRCGTRSHRDFRNREADWIRAAVSDDFARAVTATSGIVRRQLEPKKMLPPVSRAVTATSGIVRRRIVCFWVHEPQVTRSHRDFRNREAEKLARSLGSR